MSLSHSYSSMKAVNLKTILMTLVVQLSGVLTLAVILTWIFLTLPKQGPPKSITIPTGDPIIVNLSCQSWEKPIWTLVSTPGRVGRTDFWLPRMEMCRSILTSGMLFTIDLRLPDLGAPSTSRGGSTEQQIYADFSM